MMTHDPFQHYQTLGAYSGGATPYGLPITAFQPSFNPGAIAGQPLTHPGIGGYGGFPQLLQGGGLQGSLQGAGIPGQQNPLLQHPLAQGPWQNPLLTASLQNPLLNPMLAYYGWPQQQPQLNYPQQQPQFNYPLAPQSLIGAGGIGQPFGQIHPLAQLALRSAAGYGMSPWAGYF